MTRRLEHLPLEPVTGVAEVARLRRRIIRPGEYAVPVRLFDVRLCPRCEKQGEAIVATKDGTRIGRVELWGSCRRVAGQGGGRL